ncbi:MAG: hypothetical protein R2932_42755 [Caldilineaceae bacterium]
MSAATTFTQAGPATFRSNLFTQGEARHAVGTARYRVNDECYLVLNHGQEYTITIDATKPVESFCIFFAPELAAEVKRSLTATTAHLVDDPLRTRTTPLHFFERTLPPRQHRLALVTATSSFLPSPPPRPQLVGRTGPLADGTIARSAPRGVR